MTTIGVAAGVCSAALRSRLASACSVRAKSARTEGSSSGTSIVKGCAARASRLSSTAAFTRSRASHQSSRGRSAPLSRRVWSRRFSDRAVEAAGRGAHFPHEAGADGGRRLVQVFQGGGDHGEGRAQFVRDAVEEGAVELFRFGQELAGLGGRPEALALDDQGNLLGEGPKQVLLRRGEAAPAAGVTPSTPIARSTDRSGT